MFAQDSKTKDKKAMATMGEKAEDAQDEIHDASEEDPKKPETKTGKKASTKASAAAGTPVPDEDENEKKKDTEKDKVKAAVQDEAREEGY